MDRALIFVAKAGVPTITGGRAEGGPHFILSITGDQNPLFGVPFACLV